jgi:hypothetical protein
MAAIATRPTVAIAMEHSPNDTPRRHIFAEQNSVSPRYRQVLSGTSGCQAEVACRWNCGRTAQVKLWSKIILLWKKPNLLCKPVIP